MDPDGDISLRGGDFGKLVGHIYEAVEQPELWPEIIEDIGRCIGGRNDFWSFDPSPPYPALNPRAAEAGCHGTLFLSRSDLRALHEYATEFENLIVRFLKLVFLSILWCPKEIGPREVLGLQMTRRFLQERNESPLSDNAGRRFIRAMWEDGRMFDLRGLQLMRLLTPHLDRAARLQMRLHLTNVRAELVSGALDRLTLGVIFFDTTGTAIWHNKQAREIASDPAVLKLSANRLFGRDVSSTQSLKELIKKAVSGGQPGFLAVDRDDSRPLLLIATPLRTGDTHEGGNEVAREGACGVLFISDPDRSDNFTVESLRSVFDLTFREAQMAIAVAHVHGLKTAARTMGVAPTTARTQLQQVFAKTGTSHQAELAALVHRTLTHLRRDSFT